MNLLPLRPLCRDAFNAFGDVIEASAAQAVYEINGGTTQRFHDLARIDTASEAGHTVLSLFRAQARELPFEVVMLERHPLGSQAFVPLHGARYIVVVAEHPQAEPQAFLADAGQGVNYRRGVWHHPLIALDRPSDFLVLDRAGPGANCDEVALSRAWLVNVFTANCG